MSVEIKHMKEVVNNALTLELDPEAPNWGVCVFCGNHQPEVWADGRTIECIDRQECHECGMKWVMHSSDILRVYSPVIASPGADAIMALHPKALKVRLVEEVEEGKWTVYRLMDKTLHPYKVSCLELIGA
jgi:hypothetical protein